MVNGLTSNYLLNKSVTFEAEKYSTNFPFAASLSGESEKYEEESTDSLC